MNYVERLEMKIEFQKKVDELFGSSKQLKLSTGNKHDGRVYVYWNNKTIVGELSGPTVEWYGTALRDAMLKEEEVEVI